MDTRGAKDGGGPRNAAMTGSSLDTVEGTTGLVIAVCILGTLVGVGLVVLVAVLATRVTCCGGRGRLRWSRGSTRGRTRADMQLEQLAAATDNFISDSMLPGNRTGASENLGIRSPDPRRVPALRIPEDLSPSPPFPPTTVHTNCARLRQPSPQPKHRLTVLNTLVPINTVVVPDGGLSSCGSETYSDTNSGFRRHRAASRGDYARIPNNSPKPRRGQKNSKFYNVNGNKEDYPCTDITVEDEEQCIDYGHSYYKPGGYSSYIPQNLLERHKKQSKRRSPRRRSRNLYTRIPICESTHEDIKTSKAIKKRKIRSKQRVSPPVAPFNDNTHGIKNDCTRVNVDDPISSDTTESRKMRFQSDPTSRSPPLASSSRNTSMDYSERLTVRQEEHDNRRKSKSSSWNNDLNHSAAALPHRSRRVSCRPVQKQERTNLRPNDAKKGSSYDCSGESALSGLQLRKPPSDKDYHGIKPSHIICINAATSSGSIACNAVTIPASVTFIQTKDGLVPASTFMLPNTVVQTMESTEASFRTNNATSVDVESTDAHACRAAAVESSLGTSSAANTLPSLLTTGDAHRHQQTPSLLYQHSHHSSTQSLRPPSNILGGSSSFASSRTFQLGLIQTPAVQPNTLDANVGNCSNGAVNKYTTHKSSTGKIVRIVSGFEKTDCNCEKMVSVSLKETDEEDDVEKEEQEMQLEGTRSARHSSSSSPAPEVNAAIQQCVPAANKTVNFDVTVCTSFMDSREIGEPTTASMSWDHLTPDPSPVFNEAQVGLPNSHYTPVCIKKSNVDKRATTLSANPVLDSELDDTFARHYDLISYKKLQMASNTRVTANLNPAIDHEVINNKQDPDFRKMLVKYAIQRNPSILTPDCTTLEHTAGRQDVEVKRVNIIDRFNQNEKVSVTALGSVKSDESFSTPLLPEQTSSVNVSANKTNRYTIQTKGKLFNQDSAGSSPEVQMQYSKLKHNLSVQSSLEK